MREHPFSARMQQVMRVLAPMQALVTDPAFANRVSDPEACDFTLGDPHDMPLPGVVDAIRQHLLPQSPDWFAYKGNEPRSREILAAYLRDWRGAEFHPQDIYLTNGAFAALAVTLRTLIDTGDEVIYISPPWQFYEGMIVSVDGTPVRVSFNPQTFDLDLGAIEAAITPRTRAIIINTPNNPTGKIYPSDTLQGLAQILSNARRGSSDPIYIISDESYSRIIYDNRAFPSPTTFYPYTFLIYTYGKTLLAPGERIGFIALPPQMPNRDEFRIPIELAQFMTGYAFPNALLQYALPDLNQLSVDIDQLQRRRDRLVSAMRNAGYSVNLPEGTFYLLPQSPMQDDVAFIHRLARDHVYCLPGITLEMPGYFRISLTASDEMVERAIPVFEKAFQEGIKVARSQAS